MLLVPSLERRTKTVSGLHLMTTQLGSLLSSRTPLPGSISLGAPSEQTDRQLQPIFCCMHTPPPSGFFCPVFFFELLYHVNFPFCQPSQSAPFCCCCSVFLPLLRLFCTCAVVIKVFSTAEHGAGERIACTCTRIQVLVVYSSCSPKSGNILIESFSEFGNFPRRRIRNNKTKRHNKRELTLLLVVLLLIHVLPTLALGSRLLYS